MSKWRRRLRAELQMAPLRMELAACRMALRTGLVEPITVQMVGVTGMAIKVRVKPPLLGTKLGRNAAVYAAGYTASQVAPTWADNPMCVTMEQMFVEGDVVVVTVSYDDYESDDSVLSWMLCMN